MYLCESMKNACVTTFCVDALRQLFQLAASLRVGACQSKKPETAEAAPGCGWGREKSGSSAALDQCVDHHCAFSHGAHQNGVQVEGCDLILGGHREVRHRDGQLGER